MQDKNAGSGKFFYKEDLIIFAHRLLGNIKDAKALVNEMLPDDDKLGNVDNLLNRFKCWQTLKQLEAHINDPTDDTLEKVNEATDKMYIKLMKITNRMDNKLNTTESDNQIVSILGKLINGEGNLNGFKDKSGIG